MQRIVILRVAVMLVIAVLIGRLYQLQLGQAEPQRAASELEVALNRRVFVRPLRGEIFAADGKTRLAESVSTFAVAVRPGDLPPAESPRRSEMFARLSQLTGLTSTLTLQPVAALQQRPRLRADLQSLLGAPAISTTARLAATAPYTFTSLLPAQTLAAYQLTRTYSDVLRLNDPIAPIVKDSPVRRYETVTVKSDITHDLALVISENSASLPGVVVIEDYRRRYPQSANVPSISHLLGYIGRIRQCQLASANPASSWVDSLSDVVAHATSCTALEKRIVPSVNADGAPYLADDRIGQDGLEASYEQELRGELGMQSLVVDAYDRPLGPVNSVRPVRDGNSLVLTIDLDFQRKTEELLQRWIAISEARRIRLGQDPATPWKGKYDPITKGVAIALDPRSGRVLAMVSLPTYDNNVWVDRARGDELQSLLMPLDASGNPDSQAIAELEKQAPLLDRAIGGTYPPGSTLKQFVGAIALQAGVIAPTTMVRDPGKLVLQDQYVASVKQDFPNSSSRDNQLITISDALKVSSNVFFFTVAGGNKEGVVNLKEEDPRFDGLLIDRLSAGLGWFGFGKPTGVPLAGEAAGRVPDKRWKLQEKREPWTTGDTYNMAIGQGNLEVTPLQLVTAASAVANGGTLYQPQLVRAIVDSSGSTLEDVQPAVAAKLPIDSAYLAVVREGMRRSVTEGANKAARDDCSGLAIAGKTGTAEYGPPLFKPDGKITRQSHSWFVGFAPYDNPQIEVVVLLEGTGDLNDGSATLAVPAVTQIMQAYFNTPPPANPGRDCPALDK
jgi:penicillin-binding protein 2